MRHAVVQFAKWLRLRFEFPMRVPVYLSNRELISTRHGLASASFFAPDDRAEEPRIRVATGDFKRMKAKSGRDNALAAILTSVAHEVAHYNQWCQKRSFSETQAERTASRLIRDYAKTVKHP